MSPYLGEKLEWITNANLIVMSRAREFLRAEGRRLMDAGHYDESDTLLTAAGMMLVDIREQQKSVAEETAPWFDGSAFPKSGRASDLGLTAGDDCPKCDGELMYARHIHAEDGGHPDCGWLSCLDCNYQTEPE